MHAHPPQTKALVKEMYIFTPKTIAEIATETGVATWTIKGWSRKHKWADERRKLERDLDERSAHKAAKIVREHQCGVLRRHITVSEKVEEHVLKILQRVEDEDKTLTPEELMLVAKAFNSSGRIVQKAVGIDGPRGKSGDSVSPVAVLINTNFTPRKDEPDPDEPKPVTPIDITPEIDEADASLADDIDPACGF